MKKLMKKLVVLLCVLTMVMASAAPASAATSKRLSKTKATVAVGCTTTIKAYGGKAKWSSSNKKVATVNSKGKVTARKKGKTTITAKIGSKKLKCVVTVKNNVLRRNVNWDQVAFCNYEHMYFIRTAPVKMWYDAKGQLKVIMAVRNDTLGSSYAMEEMYLKISNNKKQVLAEGVFTFSGGVLINPLSTATVTLTFDKGSTKKSTDLTKLKGYYWSATTYQE